MPRCLFALAVLFGLGACADPAPAADPSELAADSAEAAQAPASADVLPEGAGGDAEAGAPEIPMGLTSVYTDLALDACDVLETFEEGGGVELRCPGYRGTELFVSEGDLRFDVDAGVPNDRFDTVPAFNTLGETVEWRLHDGAPFAIIVRFLGDDGMGGGSSDLAVISVGAEGAPGCLVGWVPATAEPSQNAAARALADAQVTAVDCAA